MWQKISFLAASCDAEHLSDFLLENGAVSVELTDADTGTPFESPQFDEPGEARSLWNRTLLSSLWEKEEDFTRAIQECPFFQKNPLFTVENLENENWVEKTKAQFTPQKIQHLWIVPSWHEVPQEAKLFLRIDPGMAFGTGTHPTTKLCIECLLNEDLNGKTLLDYGSGSGILAFTAAKCGASKIIGVDIDEAALQTARENAQKNHLNEVAFISAHQPLTEHFDYVVANILANPLRVLAPVLSNALKPQGSLFLSGILAEQTDEIIHIYQPFLHLSVVKTEESWALLKGRKS